MSEVFKFLFQNPGIQNRKKPATNIYYYIPEKTYFGAVKKFYRWKK
jgi:hypothetical protein